MVDENIPNSDAEYIKKMDAQIKQKQTTAPETPQKTTLRERAQNYLKEKQEQNYEKKVAKAYFLNFYVQSPDGKWHFYKTSNKLNKQECNNIRKELTFQKVIFKEIEGDPDKGLSQLNTYAGRLKKTWEKNITETSKDIQKQTPAFSKGMASAFETSKSGMPVMALPVWGSQNQPKNINQYPIVDGGRYQATKKSKPKAYVSQRDYDYYLAQGYTQEQLSSFGVFSDRSKYWVEQSRFGRSVSPYKPVSMQQSFFFVPPSPKTEMQERIEKGEQWKGYTPEFVGSADSTPMIFSPPFLKMSQSKGIGATRPMFYPLMQVNEFDEKGNLVTKKKFFTPENAQL